LPWRIPADLRRYKKLTMGKPMVMGRRTFESLGGPLPGRRHIVLTHDPGWTTPGAEVARDKEEAMALVEGAPEVAIVGGAAIFAMFLDDADRIELTEVDLEPEGDVFVPPFDPADWRELHREDHPPEAGMPGYSFVTLVRRGEDGPSLRL